MKHSHTIHAGKLFKCPVMANLPEFQKQFTLVMDERQQHLLDSYIALAADCSDEDLEEFVRSRDSHIPQCEFCPSDLIWQTALGEYKIVTELPNYGTYIATTVKDIKN